MKFKLKFNHTLPCASFNMSVDVLDASWHSRPVHCEATDTYAGLSPAARLVAQAYGTIAPQPLGVARVSRLLTLANIRVLNRRLDDRDIRRCNAELIEAGIAVRQATDGVRAAPEWVLPLTRAAERDGILERLLTACLAEQSSPWPIPLTDEALLRANLVAGRLSELERVIGRYQPETAVWRFLAEPLADDLLDRLPEPRRAEALSGCLGHVIETAAPPEPVIEACEALSRGHLAHATEIAFIRILQGRFDLAEAVFAQLPPAMREQKPAGTGLAAVRALIAMLRGDDREAQRCIEEALALERAGTRKRLVFPDSRAFALSLAGLVRIDSPHSHDLLAEIYRGAERMDIDWPTELDFVATATHVKAGHGLYYNHRPPYPHMGSLLEALGACWLREFPVDWQERKVALLRYRQRAAANGFDWVTAECDEVLRRSEAAGGEDATGEDAGNEDARGAAAGDETAAEPVPGHARLGTVTLATLAAPLPVWEQSLKVLEQLAYETGNKTARAGKANVTVKRRLAWELVEDLDRVSVYPREQRQNKNGRWSKGRKVSLRRLARGAVKMDFLLPQDIEAAASISVHDSWRGLEYSLDARGLHALAGHPHVFNEDGRQVDIVRREPELSVAENEHGGMVVTMRPHGEDPWGDRREFVVEMATDQRCVVTRFTDSHLRLLSAIPAEGLELPADAGQRLLEAVSSLAGEVRVQSDAAGGGAARPIDADPEPWVRLEPFEAGLTAALVVEPIPDSGICFDPGAGGATVFANRDGEAVQTRRDLALERNEANRLADTCRWLSSRPTEQAPLMLPGPAECLELLDELQDAGARCKWPKGEPFRIVARASTPSLALTVKSADEWLKASGKLVVDDDSVLDLKRLFELLEASPGSRFLELDDGRFLALTRTFRRQLDDFANLSTPAARGAVRLHTLAALSLGDFIESAELDADRGWRELRANIKAAESYEPELPSTLRAELRPYQAEGYRWLARLARWGAGACLADDMGLGKTVQTLALLLARAPDGPALVVAPTSVVANWADEARRFAPTLNVKLYAGAPEHRARLADAPAPFDLYITTYGLLQNDVDRLEQVRWRSAVLDEAQAIKNPATKRARAARRLIADFRLVTTGTPVQNNLMDLYSLFSFINPGLLGARQQFRRNFGAAVERGGDADATARLRRLIAPFLLRRLKSEVLDDLPERTEITLHVRMSGEEATLYEALRRRAVEELEAARAVASTINEGVRRVRVLAHLTRLRLACCNPRLALTAESDIRGTGNRTAGVANGRRSLPRSSKLDAFAATLKELLENHHKVLVFSQFVKHLKLVEEYLNDAGIAYQYLDGATPAKARAERINAFQAGRGDVFLISLKAGGLGLNLTAADYVIHLDPWWNPAVEDQASDRAHRIGQTRPVTIYRLVAEGTIEEQIVDLHHRKRDLADQLLEGADAAGRLNADELLALLRQPFREA